MDVDRDKTLTELDNHDWGPPTYQSNLVKSAHRLRNTPLREFTTEDLRLMIGQNIGLKYLMPLAIERLEADPLIEGDYYPGDLLCMVLGVNQGYWFENKSLRDEVASIAARASQRMKFDTEITNIERTAFDNAMRVFEISSSCKP
jgi:hypothetical protein